MGKVVVPVSTSSVVDDLAKRRRTRKKSQQDAKRSREGSEETGIERLLRLQLESNERIARENREFHAQLMRESRELHQQQITNVRNAAEFQNERISELYDALEIRFSELLRLQRETQSALAAALATPDRYETLKDIGLEVAQHLLVMLKAATDDE